MSDTELTPFEESLLRDAKHHLARCEVEANRNDAQPNAQARLHYARRDLKRTIRQLREKGRKV